MVDDFNNFFQSEKVTNPSLKHICRSNDGGQRQVKLESERCIAKVGDEPANVSFVLEEKREKALSFCTELRTSLEFEAVRFR